MKLGSGVMSCMGFLFWIGIAYFFYQRNIWGAVLLTALAVGVSISWWFFSQIQRNDSRRSEPKPRSDLPEFDFKDVNPRDFE